MRNIILVQISLCLCSLYTQAQQSPAATVASTAPANASTAYTAKWTAFHNPAIISEANETTLAVNYENRFQLKELSTKALSFSIPTKQVDIGLALSHFGYTQYNEMQIGVGFARSLSPKFLVGLQFNYYSVYLSPSEGSKGNIIAQIGFLSKVTKDFILGFQVYNPAQTNIQTETTEKRIPSIFSLGSCYHFSEKLSWLAQVDKDIDSPLIWRTGFEYQMIDALSFRVGGYGSPFTPSLGVGVFVKKLQLDLNFERHAILGINSVCSLNYSFQ